MGVCVTWESGFGRAARVLGVVPLCLLGVVPPGPIQAQEAKPAAGITQNRSPAQPDQAAPDRQAELKAAQAAIEASAERRKAIQAEIETIRDDHAKLKQALIEATTRIGADERTIADTKLRLDLLSQNEQATRHSLEARRAILAEVLAALQRMGRKPPPALLVDPDDVLKAIRTSMLLGAVLPSMKIEVEALLADLTDLARTHKAIDADQQRLAGEVGTMTAERERLSALIDARQASMGQAESALAGERDHAQALAAQASSLKDLIARMEAASKPAADAAEAARKADDQLKTVAALTPDALAKLGTVPPRDPARLAPSVAFASLKGLVPVPVTGAVLRPFGAPDGFGGSEKGITYQTAAGAVVASPSDGWIAYAGPYRSFGQLLIVNAGGGYYIVLAGMERINVDLGQFVLAGEPIAVMGDRPAKTAAALALGVDLPILYVEFRKDGATIDPGPWWVKPEIQKVRG